MAQPKAGVSFKGKDSSFIRLGPRQCRTASSKEDKSCEKVGTDLLFPVCVSVDGEGKDKKAVTYYEVSERAGKEAAPAGGLVLHLLWKHFGCVNAS